MNPKQVYILLRSLSNFDWAALKTINYLLSEGRKTVTEIYCHLQIEQSVASQSLKMCSPIFRSNRDGKFIYYTVNRHIWDNILLMCHDLANSKVGYIEDIATEMDAIKRAEEILHARYKKTKGGIRDKIYDYITQNPRTPLWPIYYTLGIEESVASIHCGILEKAGWIKTERGKNPKQRLKVADLDFASKIEHHIHRINELPTHRIHLKENDKNLSYLELTVPNRVGKIVDLDPRAGIAQAYLIGKTVDLETIEAGRPLKCSQDGKETWYKFTIDYISPAL